MTRTIRISAVPPGPAPDWVREKWVGLELPLAANHPRAIAAFATGLDPRGRNLFAALWNFFTGKGRISTGYAVEAVAAIDILEKSSPEAARWWRDNVPFMFRPEERLLFATHVCKVV